MVQPFRIDLKGDELHRKLGGGIPKNAIILIEAPNGLGKSILSQRITYGAVKNDSSVTYISSEMALKGFMNQMTSLRYDIRTELMQKRLKFITLFPALGLVKFRAQLIEKILQNKMLFDSDIIIFDTISELLIKKDMDMDDCFDLMTFFKKMSSMNKSIVFCADPLYINEKFLNLLRSVSEVYLKLEEKEQYGTKSKVIKVERFTGALDDVETEIPFRVKPGIGLIIDIAS